MPRRSREGPDMTLWLLIVLSLNGTPRVTYITFATKAECASFGQAIAESVDETIHQARPFECVEVLDFPRKDPP